MTSSQKDRRRRGGEPPVASVAAFVARMARGPEFGWRYFARRFRENNMTALSAALSFRTIFALIPILVLAFLSAKSLGMLEDSKRSLHQFLDASGLTQIAAFRDEEIAEPGDVVPPGIPGQADPSSRAAAVSRRGKQEAVTTVAAEIERIVERVEGQLTFNRIGPIGAALLIWSALTLLTTMEQSLNRVHGVPGGRSALRSMPLYWATITLGPVAVAVASYLGERAVEAFRHAPGAASLLLALGWAGPIVVGIVVLSLVYDMLPNKSVRYRAAVAGATVAVVAWSFAKWGFSIYVQRFVVQGNIYGVLGAIPLFLLWLNLSWLIFLFGAEVTHVIDRYGPGADRSGALPWAAPADVLAAVLLIARQYHEGGGGIAAARLADRLDLPRPVVDSMVARLQFDGVVCAVAGRNPPQFLLARPAERVRVREILQLGGASATRAEGSNGEPFAGVLERVLEEWSSPLPPTTLADLLNDPRVLEESRF